MNNKAVCFTGSRPQNLPWRTNENDSRCLDLKQRLTSEIEKAIDNGYTHHVFGMALGIDQIAFEIVLDIRKSRPELSLQLEAAIPCEEQATKWNKDQRDRYYALVEQADTKTLVSKHYTATCMQDRNEYMVNKSSLVIAVTDGRPSGTMKTVRYAKNKNIATIILKP